MKKFIGVMFVLAICFYSCNSDKGTMVVKGNIEGLKKGVLFLRKIEDSQKVSVDSFEVKNDGDFNFSVKINDAEMFFLSVGKDADKEISFFGDIGPVSIETKLANMWNNPKIEAGENQKRWMEYLKLAKRSNERNLTLMEARFNALKDGNDSLVTDISNKMESAKRRRQYMAANFAILNKDYEVAPYIALSDLYNSSFKLLDTINNSLSARVKDTKYGKILQETITERKQ
ncbi:MAG: DUF4369 domain-containing protein [Flavobacteriaceae bacterium]|nr:DUF4369 domain-containing protein [Flavobacteriaceae bacterium]